MIISLKTYTTKREGQKEREREREKEKKTQPDETQLIVSRGQFGQKI